MTEKFTTQTTGTNSHYRYIITGTVISIVHNLDKCIIMYIHIAITHLSCRNQNDSIGSITPLNIT